MDVSEHLQRELIYHLNAELLRSGLPADAGALTRVLVQTMDRHGPRFHEPDLLGSWAEQVGTDTEDLIEALEDTMAVLVEELEDDEALWSAHRLLDLLAEEAFWALSWGLPGEDLPPPPLAPALGTPLPLALRSGLLRVINTLELTLHESRQAQRSVHDPVPEALIEEALDMAMETLRRMVQTLVGQGIEVEASEALQLHHRSLPDLREALGTIQGWKLAVEFDASPDEDDGEWTLRILERLYGLQWVVAGT